jgi:uncharacterized protein (DUF2384 family)
MFDEIDILKAQADTLAAYLLLVEGYCLQHGHCLHAIAAIHGHRDWNTVSALSRLAPAQQRTGLQTQDPMATQAARLQNFLTESRGFSLTDSAEAIAAIRWGALAEQATQVLGDPNAASNWLRQPQPRLGGNYPRELIETDAGYQQIERLLHQAT